ncbi:Leucine-rich repeat-containing protein 59 [Mytilus coruscus]|uniref:Leucine-rich repeat-containing protein 59 n=1 Tax=Mytilus coruscus TaxID=42192 RepID=A0A6J8EXM3_MYTCO|nr:Leucine-rich repeat-containing protein 59 [Mytilus coruscus]
MPKENLKDKLDGNELDLGLSNLTTVPVKELAAIPKATVLDLSNNVISILPDPFCTLVHLVKIDLSKNLLTELPDKFGNLRNLQHLDLLGNKLNVLPLSFWRLEKLRWLDLKDNPLKDELKRNAGDCLNENECKKCAQRILRYMKDLNSELERVKQRRLQKKKEIHETNFLSALQNIELIFFLDKCATELLSLHAVTYLFVNIELEALQKEKEESERQQIRDERKAEKERKKIESRKKYQTEKEEDEDTQSSEEGERLDSGNRKSAIKVKTATDGRLCTKVLLSLFMTAIFIVGMIYVISVYCEREKKEKFCKEYGHTIVQGTKHFIWEMEERLQVLYRFIQKKFK